MSWSARQQGMLAALGLGEWPQASQGTVTATPTATPAPTGETESSANATAPDAPATAPQAASATANPKAPDTAWPDLDALNEAVRACTACALCHGRRQAVPGVGHPQARWMVVGEAPGEQEDQHGEPFVGPSGQLLDAMLAAVGRTRHPDTPDKQVYIVNTIKCRPPGNRNPTGDELAACAPYLQRQLALVKPRVVLALGRFAAQSLLGSDEPIGRLRGRVHALADGTPVIVSYHPSYLLRQPLEKAKAWADLCLAADQDEREPRA